MKIGQDYAGPGCPASTSFPSESRAPCLTACLAFLCQHAKPQTLTPSRTGSLILFSDGKPASHLIMQYSTVRGLDAEWDGPGASRTALLFALYFLFHFNTFDTSSLPLECFSYAAGMTIDGMRRVWDREDHHHELPVTGITRGEENA